VVWEGGGGEKTSDKEGGSGDASLGGGGGCGTVVGTGKEKTYAPTGGGRTVNATQEVFSPLGVTVCKEDTSSSG